MYRACSLFAGGKQKRCLSNVSPGDDGASLVVRIIKVIMIMRGNDRGKMRTCRDVRMKREEGEK